MDERNEAMRSKRPELMKEIYSYIDQYYSAKHTTPSTAEIAEGVGVSKATAYRYLVAMDERGMLEYDGASKTIVTSMIRKFAPEISSCPVVGSIACGSTQTEEENIEEYVSLPVSLFGKGDFYILRAKGDSMVDAGIDDGDLVVISKECKAEIGDTIVALDENSENTLKVYNGIDAATKEVVLLYRNHARYPDREIRVKELYIQGVAKHVIKAL